ncbi:MAG: hypothetical protein JNL32_08985 [Candidatus Kapabacteria bacterium]|nr:hypothetical protein [Candidatus Kapabacteria bacterium]
MICAREIRIAVETRCGTSLRFVERSDLDIKDYNIAPNLYVVAHRDKALKKPLGQPAGRL